MTDHSNIKLEILRYVEEHNDEEGAVNLYDFAEESEYDIDRITKKVCQMGDLLDWGVSPRCPWIMYGKESEVREQIAEWEKHE